MPSLRAVVTFAITTLAFSACAVPAPDAIRAESTALARAPIELPLAFIDGRLLAPVDIPAVGTHWFILDTAAGRSIISERLRRQLRLSAAAVRRDTVKGATGASVMEFVRLPRLQVGGAAHDDLWLVVAGIGDFRDYDGRAVEGILGVDVLAKYDVGIDVPAGVLRLHPRDGSAESSLAEGARPVPFHSTVHNGFVQFPATLHGDTVNALLDTGARHGTMNWRAAALAGIAPDTRGVRADAYGAIGMNGERVSAHRYVFERLCIGGRCLPPTEMRIMDLPLFQRLGGADRPVMLIGTHLLEECAVLLSYSTNRLQLCPEPSP